MANYVFKQFCAELDEASLDHLLDIVAKPMAKEGPDDMLESDSEEESDDDDSEEGGEAPIDDASDSDDEDDDDN